MKKLGVLSLAALMALGITGCGKISDEEGAKWAKENGYIKYESSDAFTSASKTEESSYKAVNYDAASLIEATAKNHGTYLYGTTNPDGTINLSWFPFQLKEDANNPGSYYIQQTLGLNDDGTKNQTALNFEKNKEGVAYFISHGLNEVSATTTDTYVKVPAGTPYVKSTYYKVSTTAASGYSKIRTDEAPADWETGDYYAKEQAFTNAHATKWYDSEGNSEVAGAKIYFEVDKIEEKKSGDTVTGYVYTLKVTKIAPIV